MTLILAHGLGGRSDLPVPLWMAMYGAAAAVLISFFALGAFWLTSRFKGASAGVPLPRLQRLADSRVTRMVLRAVGLLVSAFAFAVAIFGPISSSQNPAPTWFYVWFWVGLVPLSLAFGPVWRLVNPLRTIAAGLHRFTREDQEEGEMRSRPRLRGYWPATISLAVFVWLELVYDRADEPLTVWLFLLIYTGFNLAGALRYGQGWFERGDGFEVYSSLIARLSPLGRRDDGKLVVRNPLNGLAAITFEPELVPVVCVVLGSTAFDGLTRTQWWKNLSGEISGVPYLLLGTVGLAAAVGFVATTFLAATMFSGRYLAPPRNPRPRLEGRFIHSLIPIVIAYTIAHYFSFFMFEGQAGYILASDPFGLGWDVLGTGSWATNFRLISPTAIAWVQVASIVTGHILGVIAAHDRAMAIFSSGHKRQAQYALLAVMVTYTVGGIALLVGT